MTGFEPLVAAAVSGVAVPIFQSLWEGGGKVLGLFGKSLDDKTKQLIFQASKQYAQNYTERHGILKVLGMREPRSLESIYTAVRFLGEEEIQGLESIESLENAYRQSKYRSFKSQSQTKRPGLKVANERQFLMVLGGPGAGKSTFSRRIGIEALKGKQGKFKHRCIPVFIELKEFRSGEINIEQKISEEFRICGFPDHQKFTNKALEQGKLLILLDGLDEAPTEQINEATRQIQNFVDFHDKNRFIVSCRVAAYRYNFRRFTDVAMAEFDDQQIKTFITNWFSSNPSIGQDCWQKLNSSDNAAAKELTQTPLLLTLVCLLYQRARQFPTNRATLYEKALRVLLEEWTGEKGIPQEVLYKGLDTRLKETLLSEIAYAAFKEDRLFFPRREVADQIQDFLEEVLIEKRIDGEAVLKSIELQHGVIVKRAEGVYSFSHLTLQEYLTAQYIDDHRQIEPLVTQHLTDARWQEVFLLVAGLMRGGADELLLQMEKQAQTYINTPKLRDLLQWSDRITNGVGEDQKPAAKRAAAISLVFSLDRYLSLILDCVIGRVRSRYPAPVTDAGRHFANITDAERYFDPATVTEYHRDLNSIRGYPDINLYFDCRLPLGYSIDRDREISWDRHLVRGLDRYLDNYLYRNRALTLASSIESNRDRDRGITLVIALTNILNYSRDRVGNLDLPIALALKKTDVFQGIDFAILIAKLKVLKEKFPDQHQSLELHQAFAEDIRQTWLNLLQLNPDQLNFSKVEIEALNKYLVANYLIFQCIQAAVRVSRKTREAVEGRMLLPQ